MMDLWDKYDTNKDNKLYVTSWPVMPGLHRGN